MSKHPCKHPPTAVRPLNDAPATSYCVKCGRHFDTESGETIYIVDKRPVIKKARKFHPKHRAHRHGHYKGTEKG